MDHTPPPTSLTATLDLPLIAAWSLASHLNANAKPRRTPVGVNAYFIFTEFGYFGHVDHDVVRQRQRRLHIYLTFVPELHHAAVKDGAGLRNPTL